MTDEYPWLTCESCYRAEESAEGRMVGGSEVVLCDACAVDYVPPPMVRRGQDRIQQRQELAVRRALDLQGTVHIGAVDSVLDFPGSRVAARYSRVAFAEADWYEVAVPLPMALDFVGTAGPPTSSPPTHRCTVRRMVRISYTDAVLGDVSCWVGWNHSHAVLGIWPPEPESVR